MQLLVGSSGTLIRRDALQPTNAQLSCCGIAFRGTQEPGAPVDAGAVVGDFVAVAHDQAEALVTGSTAVLPSFSAQQPMWFADLMFRLQWYGWG